MEEKKLIIICITAIVCVIIFSSAIIALNYNSHETKNYTNETVNITINNTTDTQNNTTTTTTKKTTSQSSNKNSDPDYDPERDASHQYATEDNPITVQQSDGEYTYYGPGHYDYYGGGNHMSGEYYKYRNTYG